MVGTILTRYLTVGIQFIIIVVTLTVYGVFERGVVAALIASGGLVGALSSMTIGKGLLMLVERNKDDEVVLGQVYSSALLLLLLLILFSYLIHFLLFICLPGFYGGISAEHLTYFSFAVVYYVWMQVGPYLFSLRGKMRVFNSISLCSNFLILVVLIYGYFSNGLIFEFFLLLTSFVFFVESALGSAFICSNIGGFTPRLKYIVPILKSGLYLHLDTIGGVFFISLSVVIVNILLGVEAVAEYDIASRLFSLLCLFPQMVQLVFHRNVVFQDTSTLLPKQMQLFRIVSLAYIPLLLISFLLIRFLAEHFNFDGNVSLLYVILAIAFLPYFYASIISPYWIKKGRPLALSLVSLIAGSLGILVSVLLIPPVGVYGAAMGVVTSYMIAALVNWRFYKAHLCS
ncbi:lipopolysaccharide biosynthesis protein [Marinobacter sp. KMM 10035]|uniref:lipopolysaccharide biosynthesis protein n=1 Tax=Marinobacter sp. KMM 10035 TaxID=3134034 RepID=UPI00397E8AFC